jgi:hypothetical protein
VKKRAYHTCLPALPLAGYRSDFVEDELLKDMMEKFKEKSLRTKTINQLINQSCFRSKSNTRSPYYP